MKTIQELTKEECVQLAKFLLYPSNKKSTVSIVDKIIESEILIDKKAAVQIVIPFAACNLLVLMVDESVGLQLVIGNAWIESKKIIELKYTEDSPNELAIIRAAHYLYKQGYDIGLEEGIFKTNTKSSMSKNEIIQFVKDASIMIGEINSEGKDEGKCLLEGLVNILSE